MDISGSASRFRGDSSAALWHDGTVQLEREWPIFMHHALGAQETEHPAPQALQMKTVAVLAAWPGSQWGRISPKFCSLPLRPLHTWFLTHWLTIPFQLSGHFQKPG